MKNVEITTEGPERTMQIAKALAKSLKKGDTIMLTGDLGAGKTKFVEGILSYFNIEDEISSPTFNIVNEYSSYECNIYHFDVYRLQSEDEFYAIGGEEYFEKGICLIEWGEMIKYVFPKEFLQITFERDYKDENKRVLNFVAYGKRYENILIKFEEEIN